MNWKETVSSVHPLLGALPCKLVLPLLMPRYRLREATFIQHTIGYMIFTDLSRIPPTLDNCFLNVVW